MNPDLVSFLRARLDEDELVASGAIHGPWAVARNGEVYAPSVDREVRVAGGRTMTEHLYVTSDSEGLSPSVQEEEAAHIARHDPSRVLAEVAAKRAILDEHAPQNSDLFPEDGPQWCQTCADRAGWPCLTVRALAQPFADHPDFDPSWAEETR